MMARLKLTLALLICLLAKEISTNGAKFCCPHGQYFDMKTCVPMPRSLNDSNLTLNVFNDEAIVRTVQANTFQIIQDPWCRDSEKSGSRYKIEDEYFIQEDGRLYTPDDNHMYYKSEDYCLAKLPNSGRVMPIGCDLNEEVKIAVVHHSIGMMISIPFLLMTFFVYACVSELQNLHGKCLMCYVASLFIAYIFLVSVQLTTNNVDISYCATAPYIMYFAFMASFLWLNVMCIDIWWTFSGRRGFPSSGRQSEKKRFLIYSAYAWGVPIIMACIALFIQLDKNLPSSVIKPGFGDGKCWFSNEKSTGYYFYFPSLLIILSNITLFTYTTCKIWQVQRDTEQSMRHDSQRHGDDTDKQRYKLYLKLMLVFGVNWLMEIVSWLVQWLGGENAPKWIWYVTDMCNALYGVFIFFIFVCKPNVWKLVRKRYHAFMGRPYLAQTFAPTSSTRSTGFSSTNANGTGNGGPTTSDSFALTTSTAA